MYIRFWQPSLKGRSAAKHLVSSLVMLALVVGMFSMSLLFAPHAAAAALAQQQHTAVSVQAQGETTHVVASLSVTMPNVLSFSLDDAEAEVTNIGLVVGRVVVSPRCVDIPNTVIVQNPTAGARVLVGSSVSFTVSSC